MGGDINAKIREIQFPVPEWKNSQIGMYLRNQDIRENSFKNSTKISKKRKKTRPH
jgi:hypothetical protein